MPRVDMLKLRLWVTFAVEPGVKVWHQFGALTFVCVGAVGYAVALHNTQQAKDREVHITPRIVYFYISQDIK